MANWSRREWTTRLVEYSVPSGASVGELHKALDAALAECAQILGIDPAELSTWGDWCRVYSVDDEIVIRFEAPTGGTDG